MPPSQANPDRAPKRACLFPASNPEWAPRASAPRCPWWRVVTALMALLALGGGLQGCSSGGQGGGQGPGARVPVEDIETPPDVVEADQRFAGVYKPLDGHWRGRFNIYVDTRGQVEGGPPTSLEPETWGQPPYRLDQTIDVEQRYTSDSPYFQRVTITDTYADGRQVVSQGVNKVQDGKMLCVVKKPDDLVIHDGRTDGTGTILWSRDRKSPLAVEFFRETVEGDRYQIIGYGYYGDDDPRLTPRYFFEATYQRVE